MLNTIRGGIGQFRKIILSTNLKLQSTRFGYCLGILANNVVELKIKDLDNCKQEDSKDSNNKLEKLKQHVDKLVTKTINEIKDLQT